MVEDDDEDEEVCEEEAEVAPSRSFARARRSSATVNSVMLANVDSALSSCDYDFDDNICAPAPLGFAASAAPCKTFQIYSNITTNSYQTY
jgi:hypothetical protein